MVMLDKTETIPRRAKFIKVNITNLRGFVSDVTDLDLVFSWIVCNSRGRRIAILKPTVQPVKRETYVDRRRFLYPLTWCFNKIKQFFGWKSPLRNEKKSMFAASAARIVKRWIMMHHYTKRGLALRMAMHKRLGAMSGIPDFPVELLDLMIKPK
jgi:hypothetical protein